MVICPRCQQPVDETVRTTCPLCSTPISAAASAAANTLNAPEPPSATGYGQPGMAPPSGVMPLNGPAPQPAIITATASGMPLAGPTLAANQRMTLTGDVIEAPAPMTQSPVGNSQYKAKSSYTAARREQAPAKSDSRPIIMAIVVLLLIGCGGFGGWYYWMHRTNPKEQAIKYFAATKTFDAKGMYETTEVDTEKYKSEQDYIDQTNAIYDKMPQLKELAAAAASTITYTVGEPKYTSMTEATVPVTIGGYVSTTLYGQTKTIDMSRNYPLKMVNINGIWKVSKSGILSSLSSLGSGK